MSNLKQMLDICGSIDNAKEFANKLINEQNIQDVWLDLSLLYSTEGNYQKSIECLNQIKDYPPTKYHYIYCMGYYEMLLDHDLLKGFTSMNRGRNANLWGNEKLPTIKPFFQPDSISDNKNLLVNMEAGIGDQIVFVRFIKEIKEKYNFKNISIICHKSLLDVFERFDFVDNVYESYDQPIEFDYWLPSMVLPVLLKTEFKDLSGKPYIKSLPEYVDKYSYISSDSNKKKIGLRWLGQAGDDYITRVFPEELLFNTFNDLDNTKLYSLQKDYNKKIPDNITNLDFQMQTWDDTIGIIENLDLVITSCTSIAHIAGALGKEVWVIIPHTPYYTWISEKGFTDHSEWYDSVTLFRQEKYGEWQDVFEKINLRLKRN